MSAGRKPQGIEQVELLPGSAAAKRLLKVLLANLAGELSVAEACTALGLHESRFFELRRRWLEESVASLEPQKPGRPAIPDQRQTTALEERVRQLQWELRMAHLREELATFGLSRSHPRVGTRIRTAPKKRGL